MTARKKRPGKEHVGDVLIGSEDADTRLPERLFATNRYPSRRLNVYSTLQYLVVVKNALRGTPEFDRLMGSCFGKLFELPTRRCSYASVMIHAMLVRQLVTKKRYELWPVFGGNPWKFSMVEFGNVTGLPCGEFEEGYVPDFQPTYRDDDYGYWDKLFDGRRDITIPDVVKMLTEDLTLSRSRRFRLCLIIIVDGVLIPSTHPVHPTPKHVKLLENLKEFLSFQWGRESFFWTVSTMIPAKRVIGRCDDPNGEFRSKLRQKTKKMAGFPLALQLVAYELIPQLLARLGGTDELKLRDADRVQKHSGLTLSDVLEAEHAPELLVQPMMEIAADKPDGWGKWDDEIADRRVDYVVEGLMGGRQFNKGLWRGGDSEETLYDYEAAKEVKEEKKRKRSEATTRAGAAAGPTLKQRRVSGYFRRQALVDDDRYEAVEARVSILEKLVERLSQRVVKRTRKNVTPRKELLCSARKKRRKSTKVAQEKDSPYEEDVLGAGKEPDGDSSGGDGGESKHDGDSAGGGDDSEQAGDSYQGGGGDSHQGGDDEPPKDCGESHFDASETESAGTNRDLVSEARGNSGSSKEEDDGSPEKDVLNDADSSSGGQPPILVPLKEGDGVPLQWVEEGVFDHRGAVLYRGTTSSTYYVAEEKDAERLDKLVDVLFEEYGGGDGSGVLVDNLVQPNKEMAAGVVIGGTEGSKGEILSGDGKSDEVSVDVPDSKGDSEQDAVECPETKQEPAEGDIGVDGTRGHGFEGDSGEEVKVAEKEEGTPVKIDKASGTTITDLSDLSPGPPSEKHKPVELEANLASLLLAKPPFTLDQIVPDAEDIDYGYFEKVLMSNPKVLHLGARDYNLDNQFFLDLATPQKWVSSKHMEVLVDYIGQRHADVLKANRAMFVAPWFMEQLSQKARAFNAATYKSRVFSDPKLAAYLTQPGKKLGLDVDKVFTPMIWGTNHWVGLELSILDWSVLVYDPDRSLRLMEEVMKIMTPVAKMLPYLVRKVCPAQFIGVRGVEPFGVKLMADGYQNTRSGDCGPVAMKYMELAATGVKEPDVEDLSDSLVDIFRKQYAIDVYKDWVVPLYIGGDVGN